jgi:hypothetical protein
MIDEDYHKLVFINFDSIGADDLAAATAEGAIQNNNVANELHRLNELKKFELRLKLLDHDEMDDNARQYYGKELSEL